MKHIPCIKLIIPFIAGILFKSITYNQWNINVLILTLILLLSFLLPFLSFSYKYRWVRGGIVILCMFFTGNILHSLNTRHIDNEELNKYNRIGILVQESKHLPSERTRIIGKIKYLEEENANAGSRVLIYVPSCTRSENLVYGDIIYIDNVLLPIPSPANKYQFNFKLFWERKSVYYQAFLSDDEWMPSFVNQGNVILKEIIKIREQFIYRIEKEGITGDEKAVFSALFVGDKYYLDEELQEKWADAGAIHVLAVSGLHVGIVYIILYGLFSALLSNKRTRFAGLVIIIIILWLYAAFTGFSTSVIRSVTMFSFIAVGRSYFRYINTYNVIAASALIILIVDTTQIFSVGFQLSYIAVLGIVTFYPYFYGLFEIQNIILDKLWQLISVSFVAQLSTFPLTIYYFHQFPVLFMMANLIVIPLATLILYGGIVYVITIPLGLSHMIAYILNIIIKICNNGVSLIHNINFSTAEQLYLNNFGLVLLYALLGSISIFILRKKALWLYVSFVLFIAFITGDLIQENKIRNNNKLMFCYNRYKVDIGIIRNKELISVIKNSEGGDEIPGNFTFYCLRSRYKCSENIQIVTVYKTKNYELVIGENRIIIVNNGNIPAAYPINKDNNTILVLNTPVDKQDILKIPEDRAMKIVVNYCKDSINRKDIICLNKENITFSPLYVN